MVLLFVIAKGPLGFSLRKDMEELSEIAYWSLWNLLMCLEINFQRLKGLG